MKTPQIALACLSLLFAGCFMIPSPYSEQLDPVAKRYGAMSKGTPRLEWETQLGKPIREEADGARVWETRFDELNYVTLKVWFDREDKAEKVDITRAHGKSVPGYHASAVTTRSK